MPKSWVHVLSDWSMLKGWGDAGMGAVPVKHEYPSSRAAVSFHVVILESGTHKRCGAVGMDTAPVKYGHLPSGAAM